MPPAEISHDFAGCYKNKGLEPHEMVKLGKGKGRGMNVKLVAIVNDLFSGQWTVT